MSMFIGGVWKRVVILRLLALLAYFASSCLDFKAGENLGLMITENEYEPSGYTKKPRCHIQYIY